MTKAMTKTYRKVIVVILSAGADMKNLTEVALKNSHLSII